MAIRGWVYVMTNKSMPGLVKIGYSTKDPTARVDELGTGSPSKYEVVYDVLVHDPQNQSSDMFIKSLNTNARVMSGFVVE